MSIYSVHILDTDSMSDLAVIPDGFSWGAAAFGFVWALYIGAWDLALVLVIIQVLASTLIGALLMDAAAQSIAHAGIAIVIGFSVSEVRRVLLAFRGLSEVGVVTGESVEAAERRYLDTHPDVTARLLGVSA